MASPSVELIVRTITDILPTVVRDGWYPLTGGLDNQPHAGA